MNNLAFNLGRLYERDLSIQKTLEGSYPYIHRCVKQAFDILSINKGIWVCRIKGMRVISEKLYYLPYNKKKVIINVLKKQLKELGVDNDYDIKWYVVGYYLVRKPKN